MAYEHLLNSQKTFFKLFPPPELLLMPFVGLDISDHSVRFLELKREKGSFRLGRFGQQALPEGTFSFGEIKDPNTLKTALIGLRREHDLSFVRVSLPEEKAYLFRTEVPLLSPEETRDTISFQLEEHVPIGAVDAVFDYTVVRPLFGKVTPGVREVVVSVFPREYVERYAEALLGAGITPLSFEMEGSALARALIPTESMRTHMIVDFGYARTGIVIASRGAVHFTTTVEMGGEALTEAIERRLTISREEAEKLKREGAFSRNGQYREMFPVLLEAINQLKEQIHKHFIYWHNHPDKKDATPPPIEKIILTGGDANLEGLADHFSLALRVPVEVGNAWVNVIQSEDFIPEMPFDQSLSFGTTIGLALRES